MVVSISDDADLFSELIEKYRDHQPYPSLLSGDIAINSLLRSILVQKLPDVLERHHVIGSRDNPRVSCGYELQAYVAGSPYLRHKCQSRQRRHSEQALARAGCATA